MVKKIVGTIIFIFALTQSASLFADMKTVIDDSTITAAVKAKLIKEESLSAFNINVSTEDGIVKLKGKTKSSMETCKAIEIAYGVDGVKDVDSSGIIVEEGEHPIADAMITSKVKGIFVREKLVGPKPISISTVHVETKNGIVYLSGSVDNTTQLNTILELAKSVKGVKEVNSSIKVIK